MKPHTRLAVSTALALGACQEAPSPDRWVSIRLEPTLYFEGPAYIPYALRIDASGEYELTFDGVASAGHSDYAARSFERLDSLIEMGSNSGHPHFSTWYLSVHDGAEQPLHESAVSQFPTQFAPDDKEGELFRLLYELEDQLVPWPTTR